MNKTLEKLVNDDIKKSSNVLSIEYVDVDDIMPNEYNPNTHNPDSFDLLVKSLSYFGFTQPIVVNKPNMQIVDGGHRYRAACVLGYRKVPVCFVNYDEVKLRYATIMHNMARGYENSEMMNKLYDDLIVRGSDYKKVLLLNRKK